LGSVGEGLLDGLLESIGVHKCLAAGVGGDLLDGQICEVDILYGQLYWRRSSLPVAPPCPKP